MQNQKTPNSKKDYQIDLATNINKMFVSKKQAEELHTEKVPNELEKQRLKKIWRGL